MATRTPLTAQTRDGIAVTAGFWLGMGFCFTLLTELAAIGWAGLIDASLVTLFALPLVVGIAAMSLIWGINHRFGPSGVCLASWSAFGMYASMFITNFIIKWLLPQLNSLPILLAGMLAGTLAGFLWGRSRLREGDLRIPQG